MFKIKPKNWMILAAGLLIFALAGCHARPDEKQLDEWKNLEGPGEMKPGAGLFSGKDGEFVLYDSKKGRAFPQKEETGAAISSAKKAEPTGGSVGAATSVGSQTTAQQTTKSPASAKDYQEFQEYQQWKKEKQEFHKYQEWKKSAQGSPDFKEFQAYQEWKKSGRNSADYKEFLEWKEFKAYQEWKKSQQ